MRKIASIIYLLQYLFMFLLARPFVHCVDDVIVVAAVAAADCERSTVDTRQQIIYFVQSQRRNQYPHNR